MVLFQRYNHSPAKRLDMCEYCRKLLVCKRHALGVVNVEEQFAP
jgi:hypothetical protein